MIQTSLQFDKESQQNDLVMKSDPKKKIAKKDTAGFRPRTISIKVAEVISGPGSKKITSDDRKDQANKKTEFYTSLQRSLKAATAVANKSTTMCFGNDTDLFTAEKIPTFANPNVYKLDADFFVGSKQQLSAITRRAKSKYVKERYKYRHGYRTMVNAKSVPWPLLHNSGGPDTELFVNEQTIFVKLKLIDGYWIVKLAGGSSYRDQRNGIIKAIQYGKICDSQIRINDKNVAQLEISTLLPPVKMREKSGVLHVTTSREVFITCIKQRSDVPFEISGTQVRNWICERDRRYQQLRQDRKCGTQKKINKVIQNVSVKYKNRLKTFNHEVTAKIIAYAVRRKVAVIRFDATIKSFMPKYPYFDLAEKLKYKCEDKGIVFEETTQTVTEPKVDSPHIYFAFSPGLNQVKIGLTTKEDMQRIRSGKTWCPDAIYLSIDNQKAKDLRARETYHHSKFAKFRIYKKSEPGNEWFEAEPVILWLREAGWLGNAGNLSQIAQVLPAELLPLETPASGDECEVGPECVSGDRSQMPLNSRGYSELNLTALETNERTFER